MHMTLELINGTFTSKEISDLLSEMIAVKIKFHERKIDQSDHSEDIKFREEKIKSLQNMREKLRADLSSNQHVNVESILKIDVINKVST